MVNLNRFIIHLREKVLHPLHDGLIRLTLKKNLTIRRKSFFFQIFENSLYQHFTLCVSKKKESLERTGRRNIFFRTQSDIVIFCLSNIAK